MTKKLEVASVEELEKVVKEALESGKVWQQNIPQEAIATPSTRFEKTDQQTEQKLQ